jgi:hypothetical protein
MKSKLAIAKQLRREHGTITCYDSSIVFENGKFFDGSYSCEGNYGSTRINWLKVLRVIKNGSYS